MNGDKLAVTFEGFSVDRRVPVWRFAVRFDITNAAYGKRITCRQLYTLDGKLHRDTTPSQKMRQSMGLRQHPEHAQLIQDWLERHREWSRYLLSLPIDWNESLYARKGQWGDESGVSVLPVLPTGTGWRVLRPSTQQACYGLPYDYLSDWLAMDRQTFILQGDLVIVEENYYEDDGKGPFKLYGFGANDEPLLIAETITVVDEPPSKRMEA